MRAAPLGIALIAAAAFVPASDAGAARPRGADAQRVSAAVRHVKALELANLDTRRLPSARELLAAPLVLPARVLAGRQRLASALAGEAVLQDDPLTGTVRTLARLDGFLSRPQSGSPRTAALRWARANAAALGLSGADLRRLRLVRDTRSPDGVTHLTWAQAFGGIPAFDNSLMINVARGGRILSVAGSPLHAPRVPSLSPKLAASDALHRVIASLGADAVGRLGAHSSSLTLFNTGRRLVLAWRIAVPLARDLTVDAVVDATTGAVLWRANRTLSANGLAWDYYPGAPHGGSATPRDFGPWLTRSDRLEGNNAHVYLDTNDDDSPSVGDEVPPSSGSDWSYTFTPVPSPLGNCPASGCTWDHLVPASWMGNQEQNATQVFYFVNHIHDHFAAPPISFGEANGNFQAVNSSGKGKGGDSLQAQPLDGAASGVVFIPEPLGHADNANMTTPADGSPPKMQMYLFEPLPPPFCSVTGCAFADVNGGDDGSIVYHEYTHGLSNRLVLDPGGNGALITDQAGAMGEAWSDWYAADLLAKEGSIVDTDAPGEIHLGGYTDGNGNVVRTEPMDCPADGGGDACPRNGSSLEGTGGYGYGDFGKVIGSPEVHADGEIWGQTLWDLRRALIAAHGNADGVARAEQYVTRAMELSPPEPSFLDMRNAILQADTVAGGRDHDLIWKVFAARGMGWFAQASGGADANPVADDALPPGRANGVGTVTGVVRDAETKRPVANVRAGIGGQGSGLPGDLGAYTDANGRYTIKGVPAGSYGPVVITGLGYGRTVLTPAKVGKGQTVTVRDATVTRDWAILDGGATVTGVVGKDLGCGPGFALDGDPTTGWEASPPGVASDPGEKSMTVKLPARITGATIGIDPKESCFDDPGSALKGYRLEGSADGSSWTVVSEGEFAAGDGGSLHRFSVPAAALPLRYVRMTMKSDQGVLAGLQADPTTVLGPTANDYMDMTELAVFGSAADRRKPKLRITSPKLRRTVRSRLLTVKGRVSDDGAVALVRVGNAPAELRDGRWSVTVPVRKGRLKLTVVAVDGAGNATTLRRSVRVKPKH